MKYNSYSESHKHSLRSFFPFLTWHKKLTRQVILSDFLAGLTGAVIVLPQGVAYALIAGLPPEYGLYTAIITPIIAGLFGSSLHLISGPTAAISIVVLSVVSSVYPAGSLEFIPAVLTLTFMAGLIQLLLGLIKMGSLVNFISHTVVIGFTAGAALLIATSQLKYIMGAEVPTGTSFMGTWQSLISQIGSTNFYATGIAITTILITLATKRLWPKSPAMLFGMIGGSLACWIIDAADHGVKLVGTLSGGLPPLVVPDFSPETISDLLPGAFAVAILGLVEAVSISRAIAIKSGQTIEGNQEFIGQGLSNVVGSFFSCYAGSGSFTRSGVNYDSGAQTPLSAIFAATLLALILLLIPEVTALLPLPAMAGAILLIAWGLIDSHHISQIVKNGPQEASILIITFIATLTLELEFAIYIGVIVSLVLYLRRTSTPTLMKVAPMKHQHGVDLRSVERFELKQHPELLIVRIDGSIFFGAVQHIQTELQRMVVSENLPKTVLIHCTGVNFIDFSGAEMLCTEKKRLAQLGVSLKFCALKNTVKDELEANGCMKKMGSDSFFYTVDSAMNTLILTLDPSIPSAFTQEIAQHYLSRSEAQLD